MVFFCQSVWRRWPLKKYLQVDDERFPANVGTKQATRHEPEKNVVFIVFYSLYFVYYFILKYLFFTMVAPFGKDIFFLSKCLNFNCFLLLSGGGGGGGGRGVEDSL